MIHNNFADLKCPNCSYRVHARYGSGFAGYPGQATLRDDILAGHKGGEAERVLEQYPDSEVRLTSHFYRCPQCRKLSSHIRTIIYERKGWANDYNLYTEKVICPGCGIQLEEIPLETIDSVSCPECNNTLEVTRYGFWD